MVGMQELSVPEGLREWFGALFTACPDFAMEVIDLVVEGEQAAVRWRATGTFDGSGRFEGLVPTGESIDITGFDLLTVRDGLIEHNEAYVNGMDLARQLGALPAQGSMQERAMLGAVNLRTKAATRMRRA
jgi:predicted ester cyclase